MSDSTQRTTNPVPEPDEAADPSPGARSYGATRLASERPGERWTRDKRLLRRSDFRKTYEDGRKLHGALLTVFVRPNGIDRDRVGITITKRVGNAVVRNTVRRRLREIFRVEAPGRGPSEKGYDLVVNVKDVAREAPFEALRGEVVKQLERLQRKRSG